MKIAILLFEPSGKIPKEATRLVQVARILGHTAKIFRSEKCQMIYEGNKGAIFYDNKPFPYYDVLIPKAGIVRDVDLQIALVKQFQLNGIPVVNRYYAISRAKNKLRTMQILNYYKVPIPNTVIVRDLSYVTSAVLKKLHGPPVILKTPFGSFGKGVAIAESKRAVISALGFLWKQGGANIILLQEYVRESKGKDIRIFVIDNEVVGGMMRLAQKGEFRSNIKLGGDGEKIELTQKEKDVAIKAAKALKLEIAGVDIVRGKKGPLVLEVNANPGFKKLEEVTGIDIARKIIEYAVEKAEKMKHAREEA